MKNILLILYITFGLLLTGCSSDPDNVDIKEEWPVNKTIPAELIGTWKINYAILASDPDFVGGNSQGYYIKFNSDNTIEYKDGNKFGGGTQINKSTVKEVITHLSSDNIGIIINNIPKSISCKKSTKYAGQYEFSIAYPSDSPYYSMILIGTRQ